MPDATVKTKKRTHPDVIMSRAQIGLSLILLIAVVGLTFALVFFRNQLTDRTFSLISETDVMLGTLLTLSWNFFFARQRPSSLPDPSTNGANHAPLSTGGTLTATRDDARNTAGTG